MVFLIVIAICFGLGAFFGAPWVPAFQQDFDELFRLAKVGKGTRFIDLGCGNGKVLLAAAKKGATVTGYEINPILWFIAWARLLPYHKRTTVKLGSYWSVDLATYDIVFFYLIDRFTPKMTAKLTRELAPNAVVISYIFKLPKARATHQTRNSFMYNYDSFR